GPGQSSLFACARKGRPAVSSMRGSISRSGALIVAFHNAWHGIPAILTVLGYAWVLKGLMYFVFPRYGLKVMERVRLDRAWEFVVAGIVIVALGGLLLFSLISRGELP